MATYTDDFNRADGGLGANWTDIVGSFAISSNQATCTGGANSLTKFTGGSFTNHQYAKLTVTSAADIHGPAVRLTTDNGYAIVAGPGFGIRLYRVDANVYTELQDTGVATGNGDVLELRAVGSLISMYQNGVQVGTTVTDATHASGNAGMYGRTGSFVDDWEGGDLAGPAGDSRRPYMRMLLGVG